MEPDAIDRQQPKSRPANRWPAARAWALAELAALAQDVAGQLRRHASPAVRVSAALLLTASIAACGSGAAPPAETSADGSTARPLDKEVSGGLPLRAGRYELLKDSVVRDRKGIFEFAWLDEQRQPHNAYTSKLRLQDGSKWELEIPGDNADPILTMPQDGNIRLVEDSLAARQPSQSYVRHDYPWTSSWLPFAAGMLVGNLTSRGPGYYYPPPGNYDVGTTVRGGRVTSAPAPPRDRVIGLRSGVSGQAGGTGQGAAVTNKLGTSAGTGRNTGAGTTGASGATSGQAGGQGTGSAVTGKSGASGGSGVTSPSSGGFSSGKGSAGSSGGSSS